MGKRRNRSKHRTSQGTVGSVAPWGEGALHSYSVGALPIINHVLGRMNLQVILQSHLPREDGRTIIATASGLMVLVRNVLVSREPLYGVGEWSRRYAPDLLGLTAAQVSGLNDDRIGRCLTRFFVFDPAAIALAVTAHSVHEFELELEELHNDSTTVTFHGEYVAASEESQRHGRPCPAITFGHNKDHRPDLKQLLYMLTLSHDGAVPVHYRVASGNVVDDQTHRETWDLLRKLAGRADFLYVADCKLATTENMTYIHGHEGRFISVLPQTRKETQDFYRELAAGRVNWRPLWEKTDESGQVVDRFRISDAPRETVEGFRLIWYFSSRKRELDAAARATSIRRALRELAELRAKLHGPRTRYRDQAKVHDAVAEILKQHGLSGLIRITVNEVSVERFRQDHRGRPGPDTRYIREVASRFDLHYELDHEQLAAAEQLDGVFPLVTNDRKLSELEVLHGYKRQPQIEKRFEQMKTDFAIAPVWLKKVERIVALMAVYYLALLAEALLERELRKAMERDGLQSLPMYPEGRPCRCPTTRRLIDIFDPIQRHEIHQPRKEPTITVTELTALQRRLLRLLRIPASCYSQ